MPKVGAGGPTRPVGTFNLDRPRPIRSPHLNSQPLFSQIQPAPLLDSKSLVHNRSSKPKSAKSEHGGGMDWLVFLFFATAWAVFGFASTAYSKHAVDIPMSSATLTTCVNVLISAGLGALCYTCFPDVYGRRTDESTPSRETKGEKEGFANLGMHMLSPKVVLVAVLHMFATITTTWCLRSTPPMYTHVVKMTEPLFLLLWGALLGTEAGCLSLPTSSEDSKNLEKSSAASSPSKKSVRTVMGESGIAEAFRSILMLFLVAIGLIITSVPPFFSMNVLRVAIVSCITYTGRNVFMRRFDVVRHCTGTEHSAGSPALFMLQMYILLSPLCVLYVVLHYEVFSHVLEIGGLDLFASSGIFYFLYTTTAGVIFTGLPSSQHGLAGLLRRLVIVLGSSIAFGVPLTVPFAAGVVLVAVGVGMFVLRGYYTEILAGFEDRWRLPVSMET